VSDGNVLKRRQIIINRFVYPFGPSAEPLDEYPSVAEQFTDWAQRVKTSLELMSDAIEM